MSAVGGRAEVVIASPDFRVCYLSEVDLSTNVRFALAEASILKVQLFHPERTGSVDCLTVSPARREATFVLRDKLPMLPCTADPRRIK